MYTHLYFLIKLSNLIKSRGLIKSLNLIKLGIINHESWNIFTNLIASIINLTNT